MGTLTYLEMFTQVKEGLGNRTDKDSLIRQSINLAQSRIARNSEYEEFFATPDYTVLSDTGNDIGDAEFSLPSTMRKLYSLSLLLPSIATAGAFVIGQTYRILTVGSTNFTLVGASASTVGISFVATGVGSGTGTANSVSGSTVYLLEGVPLKLWEQKVSPSDVYSRGRPLLYTLRGTTVNLWRVPDGTYEIRRVYSIWPTDLSADGDVSLLNHMDDMIVCLTLAWTNQILKNKESASFHFAIFRDMEKSAIKYTNYKPDTIIKYSTESRVEPEPHKVPFKF